MKQPKRSRDKMRMHFVTASLEINGYSFLQPADEGGQYAPMYPDAY